MTSSRRLLFSFMAYYERLASAIFNDVYAGLKGYHHNMSMSVEQLEDEIVMERLQLIKEYVLKDALPKRDLLLSINCINVDCKDLERCRCRSQIDSTPTAHFEIPQLITDFNGIGIEFIGTIDRMISFSVYTSLTSASKHKYRTRRKNKPYVYIDTTPNENNMYDCFIFNAPLIKQVSVVGIFKDLRQVELMGCCQDLSENYTWLDTELQKRLTEKKLRYSRQLSPQLLPNDQAYKL